VTIKQPKLIQSRVLSEATRLCQTLMSTIGNYYPDETDVLDTIDIRRKDNDLPEAIAKLILDRCGAKRSAKEPRFDKTHRAATNANGDKEARAELQAWQAARAQAAQIGFREARANEPLKRYELEVRKAAKALGVVL
jgi:hypothetical protein